MEGIIYALLFVFSCWILYMLAVRPERKRAKAREAKEEAEKQEFKQHHLELSVSKQEEDIILKTPQLMEKLGQNQDQAALMGIPEDIMKILSSSDELQIHIDTLKKATSVLEQLLDLEEILRSLVGEAEPGDDAYSIKFNHDILSSTDAMTLLRIPEEFQRFEDMIQNSNASKNFPQIKKEVRKYCRSIDEIKGLMQLHEDMTDVLRDIVEAHRRICGILGEPVPVVEKKKTGTGSTSSAGSYRPAYYTYDPYLDEDYYDDEDDYDNDDDYISSTSSGSLGYDPLADMYPYVDDPFERESLAFDEEEEDMRYDMQFWDDVFNDDR